MWQLLAWQETNFPVQTAGNYRRPSPAAMKYAAGLCAEVTRTNGRGVGQRTVILAAIAAITLAQSPCAGARNGTALGYQSDRSARPQYHPGTCGSATQTGWASAPARCAAMVSTLSTKSVAAIAAAKESSESGSFITSIARGRMCNSSRPAGPYCRLTKSTLSRRANAERSSTFIERVAKLGFAGFACHTKPTLARPVRPSRA